MSRVAAALWKVVSVALMPPAPQFLRRTWNHDREVDLIVQTARRLLAIEVELTTTPDRRYTRHLRWLAERVRPDLADSMVVTTGRHAYRDPGGVAIVPAALLGP